MLREVGRRCSRTDVILADSDDGSKVWGDTYLFCDRSVFEGDLPPGSLRRCRRAYLAEAAIPHRANARRAVWPAEAFRLISTTPSRRRASRVDLFEVALTFDHAARFPASLVQDRAVMLDNVDDLDGRVLEIKNRA